MIEEKEIRHFHLFAGLGGGAKGFNRGRAEFNGLRAKFRCIGGVDVSPAAIRDFNRMTGVRGTVLDMFDREQYVAFHGKQPPAHWREANPEDVRRAAGNEHPHIVFLSAPCKGFSGLLPEGRSKENKYQALNRLTTRGIFLMLEAFRDDLPEFVLFENVPRIVTRGRKLLDQITALLNRYGYAVAESFHDCGEIGGLHQSRKRFLLVARNVSKVPPFLYQPEKHNLRPVGELLEKLPLPGDIVRGGAMHSVPNLQWKTWVRLAFVEAGSDWRSLNKLNVKDGKLADYLLVPERMWQGSGYMGVNRWEDPSGAVTGDARTGKGNFAIADPRAASKVFSGHGVAAWDQAMGAVAGESWPTNGLFSVADPRHPDNTFGALSVDPWTEPARTVTGQRGGNNCFISDPRSGFGPNTHKNVFRVVRWDEASGTIDAQHSPSNGAACVADPRHLGPAKFNDRYRVVDFDSPSRSITGATGIGQCVADPRPDWNRHSNNLSVQDWNEHSKTVIGGGKGVQGGWLSIADPRWQNSQGEHTGKYHVTGWDEASKTITGIDRIGSGALCVADPRALNRTKGDNYLTGGHYGVIGWDQPSYSVSGSADHDNGWWNVSDPRMPEENENLVAVIRSMDGTWHRPFTTLELAALQSLVDPDDLFDLDGSSDAAKRERIGNAVPPIAAQAIADLMGTTLLKAWTGETFSLSAAPIWVRPLAIALSIDIPTPGFRI